MSRIYAVTTAAGTRLVESANKSQAVNHVARNTITAEVASQSVLVDAIKAGIEVEKCSPASTSN